MAARTRPRGDLSAYAGAVVPDLLPGPGEGPLRLLFVGINPGLWTAATGAHFARPGNRFYPALFAAGITDRLIDASSGYADADRAHLLERGLGITNLVPRASARADELGVAELRAAPDRLEQLAMQVRPAVVAFAGITAYRIAYRAHRAVAGRQERRVGPAEVYVVPNPSGLNAHENVPSLAAAYARAATAAGIDLKPRESV
jgi:TDG/mug DNA glycosylase family protein